MFSDYTGYVISILDRAKASCLTVPEFLNRIYDEWVSSQKYLDMTMAESYYRNRSAVQNKHTREKGSNVKLEHPILKKLIEQKINYLLGNNYNFESENKQYTEELNSIFDDRQREVIKNWGKEAIKKGIAFTQIYFDDNKLKLKRLRTEQVIPFWEDNEHTKLDGLLYFYPQTIYEGMEKKIIIKFEFWSKNGVEYLVRRDGVMYYDVQMNNTTHFGVNGQGYNWNTLPFLWLKYNDEELPLVYFIKELIDDINIQESITADILRDIVNFTYVLKNYGGADLDEFIDQLKRCKAIQVEGDGGVDKLQADLNIDAVMQLLEKHRRDIYDYARSVDTQDPELGNASGQALRIRYSDLDLDVNDLEAGLQFAFEIFKRFIDDYLVLMKKGSYYNDDYTVTFKRDVIINETELIDNINKSADLSLETRLSKHPWIEDTAEELKRIEKEKEKEAQEYSNSFNNVFNGKPKGVTDNAEEENQ